MVPKRFSGYSRFWVFLGWGPGFLNFCGRYFRYVSPKLIRWVGGVRCLGLFPKKNRFFLTPSLRSLSVLFDPVFRQMMDLNSSHPRCFSDPPKLSTAVTVADLNLLSSEFRLASKRSPFVSSEVLIITLRMWFCKIFLGAVAKKQIWFSERVWESVQEFAFYNLTFY